MVNTSQVLVFSNFAQLMRVSTVFQILVFDDHEASTRVVERALKAAGLSVDLVNDSDAFCRRLKQPSAIALVIVSSSVLTNSLEQTIHHSERPCLIFGGSAGAHPSPVVNTVLERPVSEQQLLEASMACLSERYLGPNEQLEDLSVRRVGSWIEMQAPTDQRFVDIFQKFCNDLVGSRLDETGRNELKIAVQELGQNAIEWGNNMDAKSTLVMAYGLDEDGIRIRIRDQGSGFNPQGLPDPTLDPVALIQDREQHGKRPGGFGVHLARQIMDDMAYNEQGNEVTLKKRFQPQQS